MKDLLGMACSGLCICHCLLTPALIVMGGAGLIGGILELEWVHQILLIPVCFFVFTSLPSSFRQHLNWRPLALGLPGFALMLMGVFGPAALELYVSLSGGALVVAAHVFNRRYQFRAHRSTAVRQLARVQNAAETCG